MHRLCLHQPKVTNGSLSNLDNLFTYDGRHLLWSGLYEYETKLWHITYRQRTFNHDCKLMWHVSELNINPIIWANLFTQCPTWMLSTSLYPTTTKLRKLMLLVSILVHHVKGWAISSNRRRNSCFLQLYKKHELGLGLIKTLFWDLIWII